MPAATPAVKVGTHLPSTAWVEGDAGWAAGSRVLVAVGSAPLVGAARRHDCRRGVRCVGEVLVWVRLSALDWAVPSTASLYERYGEGQNRTGDTTIFSRVLYQLSYLAAEQPDGSGAPAAID